MASCATWFAVACCTGARVVTSSRAYRSYTPMSSYPELQVRLVLDQPQPIEGDFAGVVIAPHARFAGRNFRAGRDRVPAVGPVIYGVKDQALMLGISTQ